MTLAVCAEFGVTAEYWAMRRQTLSEDDLIVGSDSPFCRSMDRSRAKAEGFWKRIGL